MCRVAEACWLGRQVDTTGTEAHDLYVKDLRSGATHHVAPHADGVVFVDADTPSGILYVSCCVCVCGCVRVCSHVFPQVLDARLGKQASNVVALRAAGWHEARTQEQALVAARRCMRGQPPSRWRRQVGQARMQVAAALAVVHRERHVGSGGCEPGNRHCARGTGRCCFPRGVAEPVAPPAAAHAPA